MPDMDLSVIIVNYQVKFFLEQALLSVHRASQRLRVEVIVVDNASTDGSTELLRDNFPWVRAICNSQNVGFARANNQAIAQAKGKYVLLLNPDTVVAEDTFDRCFAFMETHPEAGGLGVKMVDGSGVFLPESRRGFPDPFVAFCKTFGLSALFPKSRVFNRYYLGYLDAGQTHPADVLSGAYMWLRREALDRSGTLDESFFMYGEDIDLSYRITQAGYLNYYFPETTIIHYKGESTKKGSLNYVRVFYQAMIIFANKHFTGRKAGVFVAMLRLAIYFRALLTLIGHFSRQGRLPLTDLLLFYGGLVWLKHVWAVYRFGDPNYYAADFLLINAPLYTGIWLFAAWLSGAYERDTQVAGLQRGVLLGTVLIAAVYGFLDPAYRTSRALILLGGAWAWGAGWVSRQLFHLIRHGRFLSAERRLTPVLLLGSTEETARVEALLLQARIQKHIVGRIDPSGQMPSKQQLGSMDQLSDLVKLFGIGELIFCSRDLAFKDIIHYMASLQGDISYKILPEGGQSVIGSDYKNTRGELYTLEPAFDLDRPLYRRQKRLLDLVIALGAMVLLPLLIMVVKRPKGLPGNILKVLLGKKTWVGYAEGSITGSMLPVLKPGVLSPASEYLEVGLENRTRDQLNIWYARDYRPIKDWEILRRSWDKLGGR